ncbi:hypothetical protein Tco_0433076 [Tanacetum coccineum]
MVGKMEVDEHVYHRTMADFSEIRSVVIHVAAHQMYHCIAEDDVYAHVLDDDVVVSGESSNLSIVTGMVIPLDMRALQAKADSQQSSGDYSEDEEGDNEEVQDESEESD